MMSPVFCAIAQIAEAAFKRTLFRKGFSPSTSETEGNIIMSLISIKTETSEDAIVDTMIFGKPYFIVLITSVASDVPFVPPREIIPCALLFLTRSLTIFIAPFAITGAAFLFFESLKNSFSEIPPASATSSRDISAFISGNPNSPTSIMIVFLPSFQIFSAKNLTSFPLVSKVARIIMYLSIMSSTPF